MDSQGLKTFVEIARTGSVSMAAENLHLTQPAVSKRLAQFESQLDTRLFDRIGRQLVLTDSGKRLLEKAQQLLISMEDFQHLAKQEDQQISGSLRLATSHHIGLHRLPPALKAFTREYPNVSLDLRFMDSEDACRAVESGELELAIVTLPPAPMPRLNTQVLWNDPLKFMLHHEHALAGKKSTTLNEMAQYPCVLPSSNTYTRAILKSAVKQSGIELNVAMSTNYLETLRMLVETGIGWSLLPESLAWDVEVIEVDEIQLSRQLGAVTHQNRTLPKAADAFIALCNY